MRYGFETGWRCLEIGSDITFGWHHGTHVQRWIRMHLHAGLGRHHRTRNAELNGAAIQNAIDYVHMLRRDQIQFRDTVHRIETQSAMVEAVMLDAAAAAVYRREYLLVDWPQGHLLRYARGRRGHGQAGPLPR